MADLTDLPTKCPAFASECPFKAIKEENELVATALQKCPAFDGSQGIKCPFIECKSVEESARLCFESCVPRADACAGPHWVAGHV